MNTYTILASAAAACATLMGAAGTARAQAAGGERNNVQITVYNQNFALVREQRDLELQKGINHVRIENVAAQIDPTSIHFLSLTDPEGVVVREQEYQYDLLTLDNILNKSVGKHVRLRRVTPQGVDVIEGTLLTPATAIIPPTQSGGGGQQRLSLAVKTDKGVVLAPQGEWTLDELPAGLLAKPTLLWTLESNTAGRQTGQISYITEQINWKADYVAVANATDDKVDLNGWVTIENRSGARYPEATLQLMAGEVRRVTPPSAGVTRMTMEMARAAAPPPQFEEKAFFEYHLYTLAGTTTIEDNSTKQLSLLTAPGVPVKKVYIFDPMRRFWPYYSGGGQPGSGQDTWKGDINVMLELKNSKENHLGMPLPKGKMRVYKADDKGRLQFVGEDEIDHTPKDETVRLWVGNAFDIVGERKRTQYQRISDRVEEDEYTITLRNHKDAPVTIMVVERLAGDWQILAKTHAFTKKDAHTIEFAVSVPKDGETTLTYRVRIQY